MSGGEVRLLAGAAAATVLAGLARVVQLPTVVPFLVAAVALALLAAVVGRAVDGLGDRLGAGATGVLQSALGNLPELFVCLFALRDGLYDVVRAALVGSVLANVLLVLGLAFLVGGLRHGTQTVRDRPRAHPVAAARALGRRVAHPVADRRPPHPGRRHERELSIVTAVLLLVLFALSIPASLAREQGGAEAPGEGGARWPLALAIGILAVAGVAAAFVSDWFVQGLTPAMDALHISQAFAGLVVVAIAGNAVENVVGIQLAARNHTDYALSVILQSPLQIALVLAPVLVLVAPLVGATFTLVLAPLLVASLLMGAVITVLVVNDGESTWLEGVTLVVLYALIATSFWWG